jgi:hypothetical protein
VANERTNSPPFTLVFFDLSRLSLANKQALAQVELEGSKIDEERLSRVRYVPLSGTECVVLFDEPPQRLLIVIQARIDNSLYGC